MIELKPYNPGDEKLIEPVENTLRNHPDYDKKWNELVLPECCWTGWEGDILLGMGGLIPYEDNAYVFLLVDKRAAAMKLLRRGVLMSILRFGESFRFKYLWTYAQANFEQGCKLLEVLRFRRGEKIGNCWKYIKELK
jgi:hypothetical protein